MTKLSRITRQDVIDALKTHGPLSRAALEMLFKVPSKNTSIQTHITNMRADGALFISEWIAPQTTGRWAPIYDLRTGAEADAKYTLPTRWKMDDEDDDGKPLILKETGVKEEHAVMAAARSKMLGLGMWGGLVRPWGCAT